MTALEERYADLAKLLDALASLNVVELKYTPRGTVELRFRG